ncbi:MAG: bifunctional glutamate N-acetyltransferase/amino-acid acetyltransferase ArgJ [Moraxella sp.]|nr:bifunctional glutamate N-acetyltransferase/amino-acid acetyltransferase ArgJ [Moraxella sp.]
MNDFKLPDTIYPIDGIKIGIAKAHVRYPDRDDLTVFELCDGANTALVSTQNAFCASPVLIAREHIGIAQPKFLLINTGNANAGTGDEGHRRAMVTCQSLSTLGNCTPQEILPFSTGVIGEHLPDERITTALPHALSDLNSDNWHRASFAIMTTDTRPKVSSRQLVIDDTTYHITGISKGAGMIRPNMATMLGFVATDAHICPRLLQDMLTKLANQSFNRITIDGDTSTNDCCTLTATAKAMNAPLIDSDSHPHYQPLFDVLADVFLDLAQKIVKDGEGATKFIAIKVIEGRTSDECAKVAYAVAHSPLVKTAFFASDPNWGRIVASIGNAGVDIDPSHVSIHLDDVVICQAGGLAPAYTEAMGQAVMSRPQITITIALGQGVATDTVYTCDLSYDYVKINADYRS